jgi:hypothetical protein
MVVLSGLCLNVARTSVEVDDGVESRESSRYAAPPGPRRIRVTAGLRAEIVAHYRCGCTSRQVAERCGIAKSTVLRILWLEGVHVRPSGVRY